jgi:hypothetical protein
MHTLTRLPTMGHCGSKFPETDSMLEAPVRYSVRRNTHKVLLLGAGNTGKSTIFKQVEVVYGRGENSLLHLRRVSYATSTGFCREARLSYVSTIWRNVIEAMQTLCVAAEARGDPVQAATAFELIKHTELVQTPMDPASLAVCMESLAACLSELWVDPAIQASWNRRSELQVSLPCT